MHCSKDLHFVGKIVIPACTIRQSGLVKIKLSIFLKSSCSSEFFILTEWFLFKPFSYMSWKKESLIMITLYFIIATTFSRAMRFRFCAKTLMLLLFSDWSRTLRMFSLFWELLNLDHNIWVEKWLMMATFFNSSDFRWLILSLKTLKTKILVRSQSLEICRSSILKLKFAVIASANSLNFSLRTILKFLSSCVFSRILSDVLMPDDFPLSLHTMSFASSAISCAFLTVEL